MNSAPLTFTVSQLAVFRTCLDQVSRSGEIDGLAPLKSKLRDVQPDLPAIFDPAEIALADLVLARASEAGVPQTLGSDEQADFGHVKAVVAAAAVD